MVSFVQLLTLLSVLAASSVFAEEAEQAKPDSVDEKWWGGRGWGGGYGWGYNRYMTGWGCTGVYPWLGSYYPSAVGMLPYSWSRLPFWLKDASSATTSRRSLAIGEAEQLHRRDESAVACKNQEGKVDHLVPEDCRKAVRSLVAKKASSASCHSCAVKLVSSKGQVAVAQDGHVDELLQVTDNALKACGTQSNNTRRSPAGEAADNKAANKKEQSIALVFTKGDSATCDN